MGSWNKRPDLLQQVRWERMMFVLSMNRFNHLVHHLGGELKDFLSQVDGRSTTSGAGTPPVGCRLLALTSRGGSDPSMAMCCIMAVLRPCIISGGYRLKSDEFIPGARSCFSWVQCRPCQ